MGWVDHTGEHEGWVRPIFVDGEVGTGTSNGQGIVFDAYTPDERVRPFSEVTHLQMVCECGWTGPRRSVGALRPMHYVDEYNEPTEAAEEALFLPAWRKHIGPHKPSHSIVERELHIVLHAVYDEQTGDLVAAFPTWQDAAQFVSNRGGRL